jgi:hypothetical protein
VVPPETHTPGRLIRIPGRYWEALGRLIGDRQRSALVVDFIRWYLHEPGAKLPRRPKPATPPVTEPDGTAATERAKEARSEP